MHRHAAHGAARRLAGLVAEQVRPVAVEEVRNHPRFKFFGEAGEEAYHSFLGVPLIDRGVLQGVLVVQTIEARVFATTKSACWPRPPRRWRRWSAKPARWTASSRRPGAALGAGAQSLVELGSATPPACSAIWTRCAGGSSITIPISLLSEIPLEALERRAGELVLHSRINYAYRRLQEYLQADRTWGATHAGVLRPRPVAYFSAEFGLHESVPIYSGGLGVLAGDHIKSASDLDIPLIGIGLFYGQGYFRQRLDPNGWQQEEYLQTDVNEHADGAGDRSQRRAGHRADRDARRRDPRQSLARESRALRPAAARFQCGRQRARGLAN